MTSISAINWTAPDYRAKWDASGKKFTQQDLAQLKTIEGFENFNPDSVTRASITDKITDADFMAMAGSDGLLSDEEVAIYINNNKNASDQATKDKIKSAIILLNSPKLFNAMDRDNRWVGQDPDRLISLECFRGTPSATEDPDLTPSDSEVIKTAADRSYGRSETAMWDAQKKKYADAKNWSKVKDDPALKPFINGDKPTKQVYQLIKDNYDLIDSNGDGINGTELFNAVNSGRLDSKPELRNAAIVLLHHGAAMSKLDGAAPTAAIDSFFNKDDLDVMIANPDSLETSGHNFDSFTTAGGQYGRGGIAQFGNGNYTAASLRNQSTADTDVKDMMASDGSIKKEGYEALLSRWADLDKDESGGVNAECLFSAIAEGKFAKGSKEYKAAILLMNDAPALNALDGDDHNSKFNEADLKRIIGLAKTS